jgi:hypothetical protein
MCNLLRHNLTLATGLVMKEGSEDGLDNARNGEVNPSAGSGNVTDLLSLVHGPRFGEKIIVKIATPVLHGKPMSGWRGIAFHFEQTRQSSTETEGICSALHLGILSAQNLEDG